MKFKCLFCETRGIENLDLTGFMHGGGCSALILVCEKCKPNARQEIMSFMASAIVGLDMIAGEDPDPKMIAMALD